MLSECYELEFGFMSDHFVYLCLFVCPTIHILYEQFNLTEN